MPDLTETLLAPLRSVRRRLRPPVAPTAPPVVTEEPAGPRFRLFGVGLAKSGTHSIAGVFSGNYRSAHEPEAQVLVELICDVMEGMADPSAMRTYVADRDRRLGLEVNVAGWNGLVIEDLVALDPDTRFVMTVRDPRSWLDSLLNHLKVGQAPEHFRRLRRLIYDTGASHPPEEAVLAQHGFYTLDGYLGDWAKRHQRILDAVPSGRLLILRTETIGEHLHELADLAGVPTDTLDPEQAHGFKARAKFGLLDEMDQDYLADRIDALCSPVQARMFPPPAG